MNEDDIEEGLKEQTFALVYDEEEKMLYATVDGLRIAKRPARKGWISLEPGWTVHGAEPGSSSSDRITVEYDPKAAKPQ